MKGGQGQDLHKPAGRVRLTSRGEEKAIGRRDLLKAGAAGSLAMGFLAAPHQGAASVIRDFRDPYLEMIRLLQEAAEIEHDLMIQYLFGAFSLKPAYEGLVGGAVPDNNHLLGVAIEEMVHLRQVNALLAALGAPTILTRQDFPLELDVYPFSFTLEPLSRHSLAKYTYCEAPVGAFLPDHPNALDDGAFLTLMEAELGGGTAPNHVGTLYDAVIATLDELSQTPDRPDIDYPTWRQALEDIKEEGEVGHFNHFKEVMTGTHSGFGDMAGAWDLPVEDPDYPSYQIAANPTAYKGHPSVIADESARRLAWLGNLSYWASLMLVQYSYDGGSEEAAFMSQQLMLGPMWSLARALPPKGYGMPFDPLSIGFQFGRDKNAQRQAIFRILKESDTLMKELEADLPEDFNIYAFEDIADQLSLMPG